MKRLLYVLAGVFGAAIVFGFGCCTGFMSQERQLASVSRERDALRQTVEDAERQSRRLTAGKMLARWRTLDLRQRDPARGTLWGVPDECTLALRGTEPDRLEFAAIQGPAGRNPTCAITFVTNAAPSMASQARALFERMKSEGTAHASADGVLIRFELDAGGGTWSAVAGPVDPNQ